MYITLNRLSLLYTIVLQIWSERLAQSRNFVYMNVWLSRLFYDCQKRLQQAAASFALAINLTSCYCTMTGINCLFRNEEKQITITAYLLTEILFEGLTKWVVSLT